MAQRRKKSEDSAEDEEPSGEFTFDPGVQQELDLEETCCVTGEPVESSFSRYPDYINGTMMVMSKKVMLQHLRAEDSLETFLEVLVERHGPEVVKDYLSKPQKR